MNCLSFIAALLRQLQQVQHWWALSCPWWCQHVVHIDILAHLSQLGFLASDTRTLLLKWWEVPFTRRWQTFLLTICDTPKFRDFAQLVLHQVIILVYKHIHVGFEAGWSVQARRLESQLYVVVRISSYDEVNVVPIRQQTSFDIAYRLRHMFSVQFPKWVVAVSCYEIPIQLFWIFDPLWPQNFKWISFVGIILWQETDHWCMQVHQIWLLEILTVEDKLVGKPVLLFRLGDERFTVNKFLFVIIAQSICRLLLHEKTVRVGLPIEFTEKAAAFLQFNIGALFLLSV